MTKENGGAAFPVAAGPGQQFTQGMSLRDWFAGQAVTGLLAGMLADGSDFDHQKAPAKFGIAAYQIADAMLAEREKGGGE